jgi:hypothetical protein
MTPDYRAAFDDEQLAGFLMLPVMGVPARKRAGALSCKSTEPLRSVSALAGFNR